MTGRIEMHEDVEYITLGEAAKLAPNRPSTNSIWRWCRRGVLARGGQRVRLQHVRIGGKIFTTADWFHEFGRRLAEADAAHFDLDNGDAFTPPPQPRPRTDRRRQAEIERAERELKEAGV